MTGSRSAAGDARDAVERSLGRSRLARHGGAYAAIMHSEARRSAQELDVAGSTTLPLSGVTAAVKDLVAVRGYPIGAGSAVRADAAAEPRDAAIVARLRASGAVVVGLTTLHEFAFGVTGLNPYAGTPENPRAHGCVPGGSSSGSAVAVAEGSARVAVGTDTGGSVRIPAALCGVVGFKPANATYQTDGVFALAPSLDTVGLLAPNVADAVAVHEALRGRVPRRTSPPRVGVIRAALDDIDPGVARVLETALDVLNTCGCELVDVSWPVGEEVREVSSTIMFAEAARTHQEALDTRPDDYGADVRLRLETGRRIADAEYAVAHRERNRLQRRACQVLDDVDCVVGPTVGLPPPTIGQAGSDTTMAARLVAHTRLANLARLPAISLPVPHAEPPVGLHVTAKTNNVVLAIAAWIEAALAHEDS
jgi:Asp-tRNA(Asn)/Glu-tRNA(Gln) amidotransferase A subunit family amidase